ncbi:hypothetical protein [Geodermatophilus sp. DSM 44513]|uniref:hypothetical protein n=1 Tax=Geodermatophilus sp. DSM 44513 TaxID=1528104 RepID=UPI0012860A87|nr:hypothetical protein [Geodermatophilus sp. DSM 44513]WNV76266.1 hypothetical protein RTG05_03070 [Geodermatophilus sp. DSM 44513]
MTTPADATADERALAACLAGRPVPGAAGLAAFTDAVRASATAPGRPNAALAELLVTGLLVPTQEPSARTAGRPARSSRKRPRMLISTLVAKFAAAGAVAKAAAGTGAVVVALTGTATTVALTTPEEPAPVVQTTTGDATTTDEPATDEPTPAGDGTEPEPEQDDAEQDGAEPVQEPAAEPLPAGTGTAPEAGGAPQVTEEQWAEGPAEGQSHGSWVSEGARQGWVDGGTVSREAHERNEARKAGRVAVPAPVADEPVAEQPVAEEPVAEQPAAEEPAAVEPAGQPGNGNGNGRNGR